MKYRSRLRTTGRCPGLRLGRPFGAEGAGIGFSEMLLKLPLHPSHDRPDPHEEYENHGGGNQPPANPASPRRLCPSDTIAGADSISMWQIFPESDPVRSAISASAMMRSRRRAKSCSLSQERRRLPLARSRLTSNSPMESASLKSHTSYQNRMSGKLSGLLLSKHSFKLILHLLNSS